MTIHNAKALIGLCIDEGLKQGVLKNRGEFEELLDYLDKYFVDTDKMTSGSSEILNDLEEAADEYEKRVIEETKCHHNALTYAEGYEDALLLIPGAFIAGAKWDRKQMMSNAVEGTVYGNGVYTWVAGDIPSQFKYGNKVRVIVLPKED